MHIQLSSTKLAGEIACTQGEYSIEQLIPQQSICLSRAEYIPVRLCKSRSRGRKYRVTFFEKNADYPVLYVSLSGNTGARVNMRYKLQKLGRYFCADGFGCQARHTNNDEDVW